MTITLDNARDRDMPGVIGFLRLLDEEHGAGIRAALFAASALDVPLEFCFTRADFGDSVLWRKGEARRAASGSLIQSLLPVYEPQARCNRGTGRRNPAPSFLGGH